MRTALKKRIEAAFADTPMPSHDHIVTNPETPFSADLLYAFQGLRWQDVPLKLARDYTMEFRRFTPEALVYYLPVFLMAGFTIWPPDFGDLHHYLIHSFIPPIKDDMESFDHFRRWTGLLTPKQKRLVRKYVNDYLKDEPGWDKEQKERTLRFWNS